MIRLTKLADYGVLLMTRIARDHSEKPFSAASIAAQTAIPLPTASKLLKQLSREGLLVSQRGAGGGYRLARSPSEINVAELIAALEGPVALTECSTPGDSSCDLESSCDVRGHWLWINQQIVATLSGISLATMAGSVLGPESGRGIRDLPMVNSK